MVQTFFLLNSSIMVVNNNFLLSLFKSKDPSSITLAVILADWDILRLRDILIDETVNPSTEEESGNEHPEYVCFGFGRDGRLSVCGRNLAMFTLEAPHNKRVEETIFSFR